MRTPPELGLYVSTTDPTLRFVVEEVVIAEGDNDFFLVSVVAADGDDDMSEMGEELEADEWADFVADHQLRKVDSDGH